MPLKINHLPPRGAARRAGSVLILSVVLITLLALLAIAYLGTSRTERFSSHQNSVNTQADLLMQGLVCLTAGAVPDSLYGTDAQGKRLRPPSQEMSLPAGATPTGYVPYVSPASMLLLGDRIPIRSSSNNQISWGSISWPIRAAAGGQYAFESPFGELTLLGFASNKTLLEFQPVYRTVGGRVLPAMIIFLPPGNVSRFLPSLEPSSAGYYLTPKGPVDAGALSSLSPAFYDNLATVAGNASGDGIADSGLWQLPCGPINGITYYAGIRVIDNNSAINASVAWRSDADPSGTSTTVPDYGYFRSNTGLQELLASATSAREMQALNAIRFGQSISATPAAPAPVSLTPYDDSGKKRLDFRFRSQGDAFDSQLARRITAPGLNSSSAQYYAGLSLSDFDSLAARFSLANQLNGSSSIEQCFASELVNYPGARTLPYSPAESESWYASLFDYPTTFSPATPIALRPLLTRSNPVSNAICSRLTHSAAPPPWSRRATYQFGDWVIGPDRHSYVCLFANRAVSPVFSTINKIQYWVQTPWTETPVKASANTATFEQLWLAYCHVMTDSQSPASAGIAPQWLPPMAPANGSASSPEPQLSMFRSCVRDNRSWPVAQGSPHRVQLTPMQMMQLRAALAAVNTLQMRNAPPIATDANRRYVVSRHIVLANTAGRPAYDVELFGTDVQPYIGAMYTHLGADLQTSFVAVQLINPYPVPINVTSGWVFGSVDRTEMPSLTITPMAATTPAFTIPAAVGNEPGIIIIEDGMVPSGFYQPPGFVSMPGLSTAIGQELIILKPRRFDGTVSKVVASTSSGESYDESNPYDLVPVDQIDMTGTDQAGAQTNMYYRRGSESVSASDANSDAWNFTWPGRYNPYCKNNPYGPVAPPTYSPVISSSYLFCQPIVLGPAPQKTGTINPDFSKLFGGVADIKAKSPTAPTYATIPLRLNSKSMPGPDGVKSTGNQFPFGGFARNGDLLQIPYVGAYRITPYGQSPANGLLEINSPTMDCSLADDQTLITSGKMIPFTTAQSVTDPFFEQIGHFCPIGDTQPGTAMPSAPALMDFGNDPQYWHYHWTKKLFDYVTVQAPHDDYFPNVDPAAGSSSISPAFPARYVPADASSRSPASCQVLPVHNSYDSPANSITGGMSEDTTGVEGLVNINTAGWKVLSMIPWVPRGTDHISDTTAGGDGTDDNVNLARAIVAYRIANGPFASLMDLYKVPVFRLENDLLLDASDQSVKLLNLSSDGVRFDFADRFLLLNRASNLITTRSDTFTCYVLLQGWRNAGSDTATLAVERRAAFFADRNAVQPGNANALMQRLSTH